MRSQGPHFLRGGDVRFGSWLCENSERAFTEGNRVLPAPRFPCCLATARDDIGVGEEGHSMRSAYPSVLTRPRPIPDFFDTLFFARARRPNATGQTFDAIRVNQ